MCGRDPNVMAIDLDQCSSGPLDLDQCSSGPHPKRARYFRAILTDAQIQALETAAQLFDAEDREFCERHGIDVSELAGGVVALQNAEVLLP